MESRRERKEETATSTARFNSEYTDTTRARYIKVGKVRLCSRLCGQNLVTNVVEPSGENKEVTKSLKET